MNKSGIFFTSIKNLSFYLEQKDKQYALFILVLVLIASVLDVFGLASLIPVILAASNPESLHMNTYLMWLFHLFNFTSEIHFILFLILALFLFFGLKNVFIIWISNKQNIFLAGIALKIVDEQYIKYMNLPYLDFNGLGSANIINSTVYVPTQSINGIMRPVFIILSEIIIIVVVLLGITFFNPLLFLSLIMVIVPATYLTYSALRNKSQIIGNKMNALRPLTHKILTDSFMGYIEIKLGDKQKDFKHRLLQNQQENQLLEARYNLYNYIPIRVIEMIAILGLVIIFLYSLLFAEYSTQIITILGLFAAAAYRLMPSVNRILTSFISLKQSMFAIEDLSRYREYIHAGPVDQEQQPLNFNHNIQFSQVGYTFPGAAKPTLKDITFTINKGETIGLIGSSGSGKTTLINILLRFLVEDKGDVLVDGIKLNQNTVKGWYKLIGYVKQDTFLMESSIKDNITLGEINVNENRLNYAIEQASLKKFIQGLPEGVETQIGERGFKLSGGQKQRIGIARALYKDSKILLFDEATSALDTATEREVTEAIKKLSNTNLTMFMIAHRITTLKNCNRIYEIKEGEVVADHNYQDLVKNYV